MLQQQQLSKLIHLYTGYSSVISSYKICHSERSEGSGSPNGEILRFAQDDRHDLQMSESWMALLLSFRKSGIITSVTFLLIAMLESPFPWFCHVVGLEREGKSCKSSSKGNRWMSHPVCASISNAKYNDFPALQVRMLASR